MPFPRTLMLLVVGRGVDSEKVLRGRVRSAGLSIRLVVATPRFTG